jgi:hypothetical protein
MVVMLLRLPANAAPALTRSRAPLIHLYALASCLLLFLCRPAHAATGYAGEFLSLGAGARALGLGSAYVAVVDDATAGYWNPAALAGWQGRQLHLSHSERFSGLVDHQFTGVALPGPWAAGVALSLLRVGVGGIQLTTLQDPRAPLGPENRPVVSSTTSSADYALYLSGGRRLSQRVAAGASVKLIYRTVASYSAYGIGMDLGLRWGLAPGLVLAAGLRDVTSTPIFWNTETTDRIQPSVLLGLAYTRAWAGGRATAALSSRAGGDAADESGASPVGGGMEYLYRGVALRAGLEEGRPAFGMGLRPHPRLGLDLAYLQHDELEPTYLFSAAVRF